MKNAVLIVRTLLGLLFLFASVAYFMELAAPPEMKGDLQALNEGLGSTGYLMPLVKMVEFLCALAFLSGRFLPLATIVIFPVVVNIFFVHAFLDPTGLPVAILVLLGNGFLAYACRKHYKPLLSIRPELS